jgi:hypothetical protein
LQLVDSSRCDIAEKDFNGFKKQVLALKVVKMDNLETFAMFACPLHSDVHVSCPEVSVLSRVLSGG